MKLYEIQDSENNSVMLVGSARNRNEIRLIVYLNVFLPTDVHAGPYSNT